MALGTISLLVVDDDLNFQELVRHYFKSEISADITFASSYHEALTLILNQFFDLYLIDLQLMEFSGFDLMKLLKQRSAIENRVIVLSQSSSEEDIIEAYKLGASNYVSKPVNFNVLKAILNKNIRSLGQIHSEIIKNQGITLDFYARSCSIYDAQAKSEREVLLTPTEFNILYRLMSSPGRSIDKIELSSLGRDSREPMTFKALEMQIASLRKKIGKEKIKTRREHGYMFSLSYKK